MRAPLFFLSVALSFSCIVGQTKSDYEQDSSSQGKGLLDPSRLSVSHSMSFGMASASGSSSLQSQSFYSTLLQYKFTSPVTLNLNFSLPIHSSFSQSSNLSGQNIQSFEYFKSIPFDVSLAWKPSERFQMLFSIVSYPSQNGYYNGYNGYYFDDDFFPSHRPFRRP